MPDLICFYKKAAQKSRFNTPPMEFTKMCPHFAAITLALLLIGTSEGKKYDVEVVVRVKAGDNTREEATKNVKTLPSKPETNMSQTNPEPNYPSEHPCPIECLMHTSIQRFCPPQCRVQQVQVIPDFWQLRYEQPKPTVANGERRVHDDLKTLDLNCYKKYLIKELKKAHLTLEEAMTKCVNRCNTTRTEKEVYSESTEQFNLPQEPAESQESEEEE